MTDCILVNVTEPGYREEWEALPGDSDCVSDFRSALAALKYVPMDEELAAMLNQAHREPTFYERLDALDEILNEANREEPHDG